MHSFHRELLLYVVCTDILSSTSIPHDKHTCVRGVRFQCGDTYGMLLNIPYTTHRDSQSKSAHYLSRYRYEKKKKKKKKKKGGKHTLKYQINI